MDRPSMQEREFGLKVKSVLDQVPVSANAQARLNTARRQAIARAAELQRRPLLVSRLAGMSHWLSEKWHEHPAAWGTGAAFVLAIAVGGWWQLQNQALGDADHAVDVQLLADEVPLDTFIDTRFEQWTNTPSTARD